MTRRQPVVWAIEDIIPAHPNLYLEHCVVMAVALMSELSVSPCEFTVECAGFHLPRLRGEPKFLVRVSWTPQTALKAQRVRETGQSKSIVERAAVALAALLFAKLIPKGQMRVTRTGERADYWLHSLKCALEVSGMTQRRELVRRQREKAAQVLRNPLHWDGYVVVCCFARRARLIRWSYYRQGGER
jgi:hypothetical protein